MGSGVDFSTVIFLLASAVGVMGVGVGLGRTMAREKKQLFSRPRASAAYGIRYSFTRGMLPWNKESGRLHPYLFWAGAVYLFFSAGTVWGRRMGGKGSTDGGRSR